MQKYINSIVEKIIQNQSDFTNTVLVFPSKRAGVFAKNAFKKRLKTYQFLPEIISIEDFIFNLSKINKVNSLELLFEFYKIYLENTTKNQIENFDEFSNWASILISDFNEIDSYLVDTKNIFSYLKDINRIENWFKNEEQISELTKKYIRFFEKIEWYYNKLYAHLKKKKIGYQGLLYREARKKIDEFITTNKNNYIFIGFNALNKAEEIIIKKMLDYNQAKIYFDIDETIYNENISASLFIKKYKEEWKYFKNHPFIEFSNDFKKEKNIHIYGVPKNVSQIKYANELINNPTINKDLALILANEELLTPTINSLPSNNNEINITMGLPLSLVLFADLFKSLFKLHKNKSKLGNNLKFYYKDVLIILNHPSLTMFKMESIIDSIKAKHLIFISFEKLKELTNNENLELINALFNNWMIPQDCILYNLKLLKIIRENNNSDFEITHIDRFEEIFNQIHQLNNKYKYIKTLDGFITIFNQLLQNESIAFKGTATQGLQIMGMLETRVLDYDTVILTSVNEGFLPAGKKNNSFIPFDVKIDKGLPTFKEKDAIFSYHFFRLIARANNIYLLYNTETDDFGSGEQSRFITQLELLSSKLTNLTVNKNIVSPIINLENNNLKIIKKDSQIINRLFEINEKGFSPTSLTNYIYNPISFYKQKILKLKTVDEIEETIAANTLGNVIHRVLEDFYKPYKNNYLALSDVLKMKKNIAKKTMQVFKIEYKNGDFTKGKNLLIFEITKQYILNFLNQEINLLKQNKSIKIIDIEVTLTKTIEINGIAHPINLTGQVDRIDILDGVLRIIDYKTGKVEQKQLNINHWENLLIDYKYSKAFQVLLYAYLYINTHKISLENTLLESGIISFKNLKPGFMKVNKKQITTEDLTSFELILKELLATIFDKDIPFKENENLPF